MALVNSGKKKASKKVSKKKVAKKANKKITKKVSKIKVAKKSVAKVAVRSKLDGDMVAHIALLINKVEKVLAIFSKLTPSAPVDISNRNELMDSVVGNLSNIVESNEADVDNMFEPETADTDNTAADEFDPFAEDDTTGGETYTKDDVTNALQTLSAAKGITAVKELLKKFKAARVSDIKETDYENVINECTLAE